MSIDKTLSPADVAELVDKAPDWVKRRVNAGKYEHLRVGRSMRFTPEQADAFIRSFTALPTGDESAQASKHDLEQSPRSKSRNK